jgi:hypothetical protein
MKTSYFKLLKLEADIPSQIDHIFFSRPAFALRDFSSCPDVEAAYPRQVQGQPNGLVIFTKNEVYVPPQPTWWGSIWHRLITGNRRWSSGGGSKAASDAASDLYPLSDHYGVAALLGMRVDEVEPMTSPVTLSAAKEAATLSPTLTPDEVKVMKTVIEFLDSYVSKLRSQIRTTRVMAASSIVIVVVNLFVLRQLTLKEENRTATMLEQMYNIAVANSSVASQQAKAAPLVGVKAQLVAAGGWIARHLNLPLLNSTSTSALHEGAKAEGTRGISAPAAGEVATTTATLQGTEEGSPDFAAIAKALATRPLWATTWVSSATNIASSVFGTAAFAIGMFQRAGNANVLEEQVQQLRLL